MNRPHAESDCDRSAEELEQEERAVELDPNGYQCPAAWPLCLCGQRGCPRYPDHFRSYQGGMGRRWFSWARRSGR